MKPATVATSPLSAALIGMAGLASAMGIGRIVMTPILPLMQQDAGLGSSQGGWLATANYIGYLAGALLCMALPPPPGAAIRWGLLAVAVFTLAMGSTQLGVLWIALRFFAGGASAMVLGGGSAWAMPTPAKTRPDHDSQP